MTIIRGEPRPNGEPIRVPIGGTFNPHHKELEVD